MPYPITHIRDQRPTRDTLYNLPYILQISKSSLGMNLQSPRIVKSIKNLIEAAYKIEIQPPTFQIELKDENASTDQLLASQNHFNYLV